MRVTPGLQTRILGVVLVLVLAMYGAALGVLGLPMKERAQAQLQANAERELSAIRTAITDALLLRDYPAVEQTLRARVQGFHVHSLRFETGALRIEAGEPVPVPAAPHWFVALLDMRMAHASEVISMGGVPYGTLAVALDPAPVLDTFWALAVRFTLLAGASLLCVAFLLYGLLTVSLRGLVEMRDAARLIESGNLAARARMRRGSPPEVRTTQIAFNHMAERVQAQVAALESERAQVQLEKERLRVIIESIGDGVLVTDAAGRVDFLNPRAEELTGYRNDEAHGLDAAAVLSLVDEMSGEAIPSPLESALRRDATVALDAHVQIRRRDGKLIAISDSASPVHAADGRIQGGVLVFQDETERRRLMQRLIWQAERDPLTGLYNRRAMEERLSAALGALRQGPCAYVFCYIDLDRFKLVNDSCGHRAGDALLQKLTVILARRVEDTPHCLARLGGDEFGLLFVDTALPDALDRVQTLRDEIGRFRFEWDDKVFRLGVSFGVTALDAGMTDVGEILAQADTACYHAKSLGGNVIQVYEKTHPGLRRISDEMAWIGVITRAFEAHRFVLYRQEKVALSGGGRGRHYEVLIRMRGDDDAIISPGEFLPAAERYGLALSFDRWVVRNVFAWLDTHPEDTACYALNLSGRSLSDPGTADFVLAEIDKCQFDPARISFEVTETAAIDNLDTCERIILALKSRGIQFALDDFGRGQSSFGYLKRLPVASLKIDGDFVRGLDTDREKLAIVKAMHTLAHELGKQTVAEQVETEAELACLKALGIDYVQGYLLDRPAPLAV